jgi:fructose-1,6-bisphosphatase I
VIYGSSTVLAYTAGEGVHMFTLDPSIGAYLLARENVRMPASGRIYSVNEAYRGSFSRIDSSVPMDWAKDSGKYSSRYIGSLVADFHRTLIRGGVFLYPGTKRSPQGKLRLLYEANPLAFVAEQAGGLASDGEQSILDKQPQNHARTNAAHYWQQGRSPTRARLLAMLRWFEHHQVYHPKRALDATGAELKRPFEMSPFEPATGSD